MTRCSSCSAETDAASRVCPACGVSLDLLSSPTVSMPERMSPAPGSPRPHGNPSRGPLAQGRFLPGTLLGGRYRVVGMLGRGGMGEVYRADDTKLGQVVALKFLPETLTHDADRLESFHAEARIGRQVSHPNVCRIYDLVELDGLHCLSMEYVDGEDLATLLKRIGRLPSDKAVEIARDLCAGLAAAHDKGVIHRDLKPANVMIDGQGRARITDFGLAALAEETGGEGLVGTPGYMAPEQLEGKPASIRSDIFALGLILYETFTGKRRFEAKTLAELKSLHANSKPTNPSSSARDIPPAVERAILRCLEKEPGARPLSAHAVMAALPGGDPLQAALAAGETPSPAMVVAAGKVGDLQPGIAWASLLAALAGLILLTFLASRTTMIGKVRPGKPPEALTEKAREILAKLGYSEPPTDSAGIFQFDADYLNYIEAHDRSAGRWEKIDAVRPGPLQFIYRQSPRKLLALRREGIGLPGPSEVGRIKRDDPPVTLPGMSEVVMDQRGDLIGFRAVPPQLDPSPATGDPDWAILFGAAGLDTGALTPVAPRWAAPVDSDRKAAWDGAYAGQPEIPVHVEAAAYHGKPVWFEVQGPWVRPVAAGGSRNILGGLAWILLCPFIGALVAMIILGRRNMRLGRGDKPGALRLAGFLFISTTLALLLRADHVALLISEFSLVLNMLSQALFWSALVWISYIALEPIARRRWPTLLIAWSRLLAGRFRDPLVGRDVLLGGITGIALTLVAHLAALISPWFGRLPPMPEGLLFPTVGSVRHLAYHFFLTPFFCVLLGVGGLIGRYFYGAIFRWRWLALAVQFSITYFFFAMMINAYDPWSLPAALITAIWLAVLLRVGVLASCASVFFFFLLKSVTPLTLDFSAWYAGQSLLCLTALSTLLICGFYVSLGGKPLFGRAFLETEDGGVADDRAHHIP